MWKKRKSIFFGAKKLPELARGLGQGIREFKRASCGVTIEIENRVDPKEGCPSCQGARNQLHRVVGREELGRRAL